MDKQPSREALALSAAMAASGRSNVSVADYMGVSPGLVSQWVTGRRPVPPEKAVRLAGFVEADPRSISAKYSEVALQDEGNVVPIRQIDTSGQDERRPDLIIARLENDVDSLRYALGALVTVMAVHRPAEGEAVAKALRKHVPAKFVNQGYVSELLRALDKRAAK